MTLLSNGIALGLLTNTIYDIVKYTCERFFACKKIKEKTTRGLIEKKIIDSFPDNLYYLLDTSVYVSYFNSPQFLDIINSYLEHKIICNHTSENSRIKKQLKKSGIIELKDIIEYISSNIFDLYVQNQVLVVPIKQDIIYATEYILTTIEAFVVSNLSSDVSHAVFLVNSRTDSHYKDIMSLLENLQNSIQQISEKPVFPVNTDFEGLKSKYHNILQEKNSEAHIYLLDKFPFEQFYVPPILQNSSANTSFGFEESKIYTYNSFTSWKDIFVNNNIVYLTGGAGYGKSLFTKKVINDYENLNIFHSNEYLVIFGELKDFFPNGAELSISVVEFLKQSIKSNTLLDVSSEFIEHYLYSGRCIILLDALDEVEKSKRNSLHESVIAFFKNQNPNNKICITSRNRGFIPEKNIEVFKICPLNRDQIEKYVDKIIALRKFEKSNKESFMNQSQTLVEKGFLSSFLILSLLINIYKAELELPENKLELYQKCFEYIAKKRELEKTQKEFDWRLISPIMKDNTFIELSRLGLPNNSNIDRNDIKDCLLEIYKVKYGTEVEADNAIDEFLKFCSDRTELFVPTAEDKYKFFHRSFFEYFYSLYIFLRCNGEKDILDELIKFDIDSEVFELTVAMLKQKDEMKYQALMELMFKLAEEEFELPSSEFTVFNVLVLSMQVVDDALYKKRFLDIIINNKTLLCKNLDCIHNLKLIPSVYADDTEAYEKICTAYEDECLYYIFNNYDTLFQLEEMYQRKNKISYIQRILDNKENMNFSRQWRLRSYDADMQFFVPILSLIWDYRRIFMEADDEMLMKIYKKFYPGKYRKKLQHTRESIEKYRNLSEEEQKKLDQHIFPIAFKAK